MRTFNIAVLLATLAGMTGSTWGQSVDRSNVSITDAVEQAHTELWSKLVDKHGILLGFVGELPTPDDCTSGRPNVIGWWSPIENGPMFSGLYLPAMCERARRSGRPLDKEQAQRLAAGLVKCASVSDVPGFIARGMGTDGVCHYPLGSEDQTHPWFLGLHAYVTSGLPASAEREAIIMKMKEVANALEANFWQCPCDGAFAKEHRGAFRGHLFRDAVRYLYMLSAMYDVTHEQVWLDRYQKAMMERPVQSEKTRIEICAAGYGPDREAIKHIDEYQLWIYVGCQASLEKLITMETAESIRTQYQAGMNQRSKRFEGCRVL